MSALVGVRDLPTSKHHLHVFRELVGHAHKSRREDKWGGIGFSAGDVLGLAICLLDNKQTKMTTNTTVTVPYSSTGGMQLRTTITAKRILARVRVKWKIHGE